MVRGDERVEGTQSVQHGPALKMRKHTTSWSPTSKPNPAAFSRMLMMQRPLLSPSLSEGESTSMQKGSRNPCRGEQRVSPECNRGSKQGVAL